MSKKYNWKYGSVGSSVVINQPTEYGYKEISNIQEIDENNLLFITGYVGNDNKTLFKLDINKQFYNKDININIDQVVNNFLQDNKYSELKIIDNLQITFTN